MKKMAFVDLTNFKDWPMGGMLQYELKILPALCQMYDVDLWGVSVDNKKNKSLEINGKQYPIYTWANAKTDKRLITIKLIILAKKGYCNKNNILRPHIQLSANTCR